ncbi:MAG TPA: T9SS type A sorting domain-containing protein [Hanamia sp.]|nr:T9SS type A sorting domain-containing protein [Hanamia sp.]
MDNNVISSFNYGTEFKLSFNFKQSYSYTIKVKADAVIGTPSDPWPRLRIDVSSASNGSGAFCNGPESINTTSSLNYYNNQQISPGQFVDYTFNIPSLSTAMSFLYVGSFPQLNGSSSTIEINKITITEIPPSVSFTLPASTTFACGTTTPQTFTITNVYNTTGITNYTWNLGSASNNWLYNGGPAPQTISTGTTGSISLTPVCGAVQTNVFATVTANGNTYNTNTTTVSATPPIMSINGSNAICSGSSSYLIDSLPCNSTVVWSVSPTGIVSLNTNNNQATLTKTGVGVVTLTATINNNCAPATLTKRIAVGTPSVTITGPSSICECQCCNYFTATDIPGATYNWSISPTTGNSVSPSGNQAEVIITGPCYLTVQVVGTCGTTSATRHIFLAPPSQCHAGCSIAYTITPNPAQNNITISLLNTINNKTSEKQTGYQVSGIKSLQIYDVSGHLIKQLQTNSNETQQVKMDVSSLTNGTYSIVISDGKIIETHEIIIQR